MTQIDTLNKKLSITNQQIQLATTPNQKQELQKKLQIIQYKIQIERIKELISKLN